jgi:hypothetical protein
MAKKQIEVASEGIHHMDDAQLQWVEFKNEWSDWLAERRLKKNPVTDAAAKRQLVFLRSQPDPIAVISQSIMCGYTGLFPTKNKGQALAGFRSEHPESF